MNHFCWKDLQSFVLHFSHFLEFRSCHWFDSLFVDDKLLVLCLDGFSPIGKVFTNLFVADRFGDQKLMSKLLLFFSSIFIRKQLNLFFNFNLFNQSFVELRETPHLFREGAIKLADLLGYIVRDIVVDGLEGLYL